jgi:hypothetical protein
MTPDDETSKHADELRKYAQGLDSHVNRQLDYLTKVAGMSLPTLGFLIGAFGWRSADGLSIRLAITIGASVFMAAFLVVELWLMGFAAQANVEGQRVGILQPGKGFFSEVGLRRCLWAKLGLSLALVWGLFIASAFTPAPSGGDLPPNLGVGSEILAYRGKAGGEWVNASTFFTGGSRFRVAVVRDGYVKLEVGFDAPASRSSVDTTNFARSVWINSDEVIEYALP